MKSQHHKGAAAGFCCTGRKSIKSTAALSTLVSIAMSLPAHVLAQAATPQTEVAHADSADLSAQLPAQSATPTTGVAQARSTGLPAQLVAQTATPQTAAAATPHTTAPAAPQTADEQPGTLETVTVTGSRVITNGFEAPTPLTVIGTEQLENRSEPNLVDLVAEMPSVAGSGLAQTNTNGLSGATSGLNQINLRALGPLRTLVLLDGQRTVGSTTSGQGVDISSYPQQLISRVDIVTGGASAVYGSDAVAGVVNFILDKNFTGFKAELSGGATNYGDEENFTLDLTGGIGFADNRGHLLMSFEQEHNGGTDGDGGRKWDRTGTQIVANPAYTATNGQPQNLVLNHVGTSNATLGGIVVSGPLRGLYFGQGGAPSQFNFGPLTTATQTVGGDWAITDTRENESLMQMETRTNVFIRPSYDITDNIDAYVEAFWTRETEQGPANLPYASSASTEPVITLNNAFLPASVRAAMVADGLSQIQVGTYNSDIGYEYVDNIRTTVQGIAGLDGKFDVFGTDWKWNLHASYGVSPSSINYLNTYNLANYANAVNAVVNPKTGAIVCQITLTNGTPCSPWNPLGTGVNNGNAAGRNYIIGNPSHASDEDEQTVYEGTLTGAPISDWAGPVTVALDVVHRIEAVHNNPDPVALAILHNQGNPGFLDGQLYVTEGAVETLVPLAKDMPFAQSWDFNGAFRATDYSQAGYTSTWKLGTTYRPIQDILFRLTRSLDIRAPNVQDLYSPAVFSTGTLVDPFTNTTPTYKGLTRGNIDLNPERAQESGLGVVLTPRFLPGFTASVDWWQVDIKHAIGTPTAQALVNACFSGTQPSLCADIIRTNGQITTINLQEENIGSEDLTGMDLEGSYHFRLGSGDVILHNNTTIYFNNFQSNGVGGFTDYVDQNDGSLGPPRWRMTTSATYLLNPFTFGLAARMVSPGVLNNQDIQCTANCPASTATNPTINNNHLPGALYFDTNFQYALDLHTGSPLTVFLTVRNILNRNPPQIASEANYAPLALQAAGIYDINGTVFRAGVRFKF